MEPRLIKAYWDCKYCSAKHIDGLLDVCRNCGKQKSDDVKYYMGEPDEVLTDTDLAAAKIKREECDGKHTDWICKYCSQLNNYSDEICVACGAPRDVDAKDYGEAYTPGQEPETEPIVPTQPIAPPPQPIVPPKRSAVKRPRKAGLRKLFGTGIVGLLLLAFAFLLWPMKETVTVTGFEWNRKITIEECNTYEESDWSLPAGARQLDAKEEFYGYEDVIDHYETKTREVAEQVITGYDNEVSYQDNGNGTFTEIVNQVPIYGTEYHTETYEEPVYRQEEVYKTKYYYEIDRWEAINTFSSSGHDQDAYWNDSYSLASNERDSNRTEQYLVLYTNGKKAYEVEKDYAEWINLSVGDEFTVTKNRLGITY